MARLFLCLILLASSALAAIGEGPPCQSNPVVYCKVPRNGRLPIPIPKPVAPCAAKAPYRHGPTNTRHDFYLGEIGAYTQVKFNNPSQLHGCLYGGIVGLESQLWWGCYGLYNHIFAEGYWNAGRLTGRPCQRSSINEYLVDWHLGWAWRPNPCVGIFPYTGLGYNSYKNRQDPQAPGISYRFEKIFVPVGLKLRYRPLKQWEVALEGEGRFDVSSSIYVIHRCIDSDNNASWRVQLPITYYFGRFCRCFDAAARVTPFYDWGRFGRASGHGNCHIDLPIPSLRRWMAGCQFSLVTSF